MRRIKNAIRFPAWFRFSYILLLLFGCGGGGSDNFSQTPSPSAEAGSIQFEISWENAPVSTFDSSTDAPLASLDCASSGISTVEARIYEGANLLVPAGQWSCSAHSGTLSNVPIGSNRTLMIFGKDSQGNNVYIGGPVPNITVQANQTYNAGTITATPYVITLASPANNSSVVACNFGFQWSGAGTTKFQIQIDDNADFSSPISTPVVTQNSYSPSTLNPSKYYWRVRGDDGWGNLSKWSTTWSFTVLPGTGQPPPAPGGVHADPGDGLVTVSWNSVVGATSYNLFWSLSSGVTKANGTKISGVISPYPHTGRINGITYYYIVTAVNDCGESSESSQGWATPGRAPSAPTGVTATAGDGQVTISWNSVAAATSYNIYWSTTSGVTKANGAKIANVPNPYTQTGRTNGTTYYYVVTAVNSYGESGDSAQVSATPFRPPSAPTGVTATPGDSQISVSWNGVSGATSYNIYWSTTSGVTKTNGTKISNVTSPFVHMGRTNGTTYYYVVTAVNNYGESVESTQVSATPVPPPSPPTGVTATAGNKQITISWNPVSGATSYNIYWSTTTGVTKANGTKIANVPNPYNHNQRTSGTTYYYVVTAVNSSGESSESAQVSATAN